MPHKDHTLDPASTKVHPDTRADDIGASGTVNRNISDKQMKPGHVDHGIDQVMKEPHAPHKDHGGDAADSEAHKDEGGSDTGASGAVHR